MTVLRDKKMLPESLVGTRAAFVAVILGVITPGFIYAEDLGRLFLTPEERVQLERARHPPPKARCTVQ